MVLCLRWLQMTSPHYTYLSQLSQMHTPVLPETPASVVPIASPDRSYCWCMWPKSLLIVAAYDC